MDNPDHPPKVTLEALLQLKRTERPAPDFWANFERELRQKQLAALLRKRRWWHEVPVLFSWRTYLPVGASAVCAFTLIGVRYSSTTQIGQIGNLTQQSKTAAMIDYAATEALVTESTASIAHTESLDDVPALSLAVAVMPVAVASASEPIVAESPMLQIAANLPKATGLLRLDDPRDDIFRSQLSAPEHTKQVETAQPEFASAVSVPVSKYRLIARYADRTLSPAPAAPAVVRERLARRLGDDLGDNISRIGVVGDRVSLKF
jgi:hypothetical protein